MRRGRVAGAVLVAALAVGAGLTGHQPPRILWWQGRPVSWAGDAGVVLAPGGQLLDFKGSVPVPLLLRAGAREMLEATLDDRGRIWLVDASGSVQRRTEDGLLHEAGRTAFDIPTLAAGPDGAVWAARSPRQFTFRPESSTAPAVIRMDSTLRTRVTADTALVPSNPFLAQLVNAGHVLALADGGVVFAPFVRDEVVRYAADGAVMWRLERSLTHATPDPALRVVRDSAGRPDIQVDYAPVNLGLALGPDGRLYVLSTPSATTSESRLDAVDMARGAVTETWRFPTALPTIAVDARGRLTTPDPLRLLPAADPGSREAMASFDLEAVGAGRVRLSDFARRPVLVNFWASWCGPCREEMPALDSLVRSYGGQLGFAALSDDIKTDDARAFLRERGFTFAAGLGHGKLKPQYHFVGLPHTILADAEGRIIWQWTGYGGAPQLRTIAALVDAELARATGAGEEQHRAHH